MLEKEVVRLKSFEQSHLVNSMRSFTYKIYIRFYYFYDSKHVSDMVALKLPKREFKGLLNFVRERIKHVYGIILLGTALKKSAVVQTSKNTITPDTSKSISKYRLFTFNLYTLEKYDFLYFTLNQVKHYDNSRTLCRSR